MVRLSGFRYVAVPSALARLGMESPRQTIHRLSLVFAGVAGSHIPLHMGHINANHSITQTNVQQRINPLPTSANVNSLHDYEA